MTITFRHYGAGHHGHPIEKSFLSAQKAQKKQKLNQKKRRWCRVSKSK